MRLTFKCESLRRVWCRFCIHSGKCCDKLSIAFAVIVDKPSISASLLEYCASGAIKLVLRCCNIGANRSSSSSLGSALAVNSSCSSNRRVNSATTRLCCSRWGTYALPRRRMTRRCSTSSGTRSQSTLNQLCSSPFLKPPTARNASPNSLFSSSLTSSHSRFRELTKDCRSRGSSSLKRRRKSIVSSLENRLRRSSVLENANRRMKWL